ncbi:MAG: hypothetical protein HY320_07305, partial [Armatimonadetes bacterium]|nr:hypothetical protein [Armatimonadota bacterium]
MIRAHILCLLLASAALAQGQDKPPPIHPDVAAFAEAHRRVQTLRATVKTRYFGDRDVSVTLTFARPGRSRLEVKGEHASLRVRRGDRSLSVNPRENQYYRRDGEANPSGWTGFSDPATSILTLLEPGPQDRDLLEHGWLPRLRSLGTETVDGQPLVHLRGWAQSARLDLWYSPTDGLLRRFALSDADGAPFANGTIAIEALNQPVPAATFDLRPPRGMLAPEMEAWREVRSFPPLGPALARLTGRPRTDDLRQMAGIYHDSGQSALAVLLLCQAARLEPTPARYQEALQAALEQGALLSVTRLYNDAMRRFGERFIRGQDTLLLQLMGAPQVPPELHTLLKSQLRTAGAWEARLSLARLALQRGAAREALDLFLGAVPEGEPEAELRRRVDALGEQSDFLAPLARAITPVDRPRLAAALRRLDAYVAPEALSPWIDCYASLDQPDTALQLFERTEPDQLDYSVLSRLGDRLLAAGRRPDAERVLRQALAAVVTDEWISYQMVGQLLVSPGARTLLAPVLRQLAEADRPRDPYQAGHWLFLAGDWPAAMQAYRDFLERTAGGPEAASAALRCASACLGVEAAAQAGDEAQRQWFIGVAADELPFVCAEQPGSSWQAFSFLSRWLPQIRDPALRARVEERLIDAVPDLRLQRVPWGGGPEIGLPQAQPPVVAPGAPPSPEEQARVKQILSSLLRRGLLEEVIVSPCVAAGLTEE